MRGAGSSGGRASPAGPHPHSGRALRPQHGTGPLSSWSPGPSGAHAGPRGCPPEHGRVTWSAIHPCLGSVGTGAISPTRVAPVGVPRGWAVTGSGERAGPQVWGLGSRTPGLNPAAGSLCPQCWGSGSSAGAHPTPMNHSHPGPPPWALGPGDRPALASLLTAAEATGPGCHVDPPLFWGPPLGARQCATCSLTSRRGASEPPAPCAGAQRTATPLPQAAPLCDPPLVPRGLALRGAEALARSPAPEPAAPGPAAPATRPRCRGLGRGADQARRGERCRQGSRDRSGGVH